MSVVGLIRSVVPRGDHSRTDYSVGPPRAPAWFSLFLLYSYLPTVDPSFSASGFVSAARLVFDRVTSLVADGEWGTLEHMVEPGCLSRMRMRGHNQQGGASAAAAAGSHGTQTHAAGHVPPISPLSMQVVDVHIVAADFDRADGAGGTPTVKPVITIAFDVIEARPVGLVGTAGGSAGEVAVVQENKCHVWQFRNTGSFSADQLPDLWATLGLGGQTIGNAAGTSLRSSAKLQWMLHSCTVPVVDLGAAPDTP